MGTEQLGRRLFALIGLLVLGGCAGQATSDARGWYGNQDGVAPKSAKVYICHGFGCTYKTPINYSRKDLNRIRSILASGKSSPAAERKAIGKAVQWQERRVAAQVGSQNDVGGFDAENSRKPGQMDCIDESTNTTSLLLIAEKNGFLKHHKVSSPVARGFLLDGRYPHATATVTEKKTGTAYAIDSWVRANGAKPDIMPLAKWMEEGSRLGS
ncbi:hypothetical protein [Labrenzia sp. PHM005]|uniref:hypothetical protein n=1 Tax=Labrenzia sp. PHM005 TaxID=2590016 RepID=UPI0011407AD7|nr:hypothetical protein [Labrenzia sp. PHM005]QDG77739.1 hypothetical protein FJ695_18755 [Labrenzia sp. PHM005]